MKKVLTTAAIVMSLMACSSGNSSETNSDTTTTTMGDTSSSIQNMPDTSSLNTGDSTGINRDTARADRTRLNRNTDTSRRRIDSVR